MDMERHHAFRLVEFVAHKAKRCGRLSQWASKQRLTVVRVLVMAKLFSSSSGAGRAALRACSNGRRQGLHVEVVALADTASYTMDIDAHVKRSPPSAGSTRTRFSRSPTSPITPSDARVRTWVSRAASPPGRSTRAFALGAGDGTTTSRRRLHHVHFQRTNRLQGGPGARDAQASSSRSVTASRSSMRADGAGPVAQPGRRENDPEKFRAMGLVSRLLGLGATFHYEGGLQAQIRMGSRQSASMPGSPAETPTIPAGDPSSSNRAEGGRHCGMGSRSRHGGALEVRRSEPPLRRAVAGPAIGLHDGWLAPTPFNDGRRSGCSL